jgi:acyl-CoA hydrolase
MPMTPVTTFRKLVKPKDLNPANRLFGGQMMAWLDEAAALFVMCKTGSSNIVTLKVSEVLFEEPVKSGDFLSFDAVVESKGRTSITIGLQVWKKEFKNNKTIVEHTSVCKCSMVFVTIDPETGKPIPHGI